MKQIGSQRRETLKESGYVVYTRVPKAIILYDPEVMGNGIRYELWSVNDHYAGYVIQIGRWGYEFVRSMNQKEVHRYLEGVKGGSK